MLRLIRYIVTALKNAKVAYVMKECECPKCGSVINHGSSYCSYCGQRVEEVL